MYVALTSSMATSRQSALRGHVVARVRVLLLGFAGAFGGFGLSTAACDMSTATIDTPNSGGVDAGVVAPPADADAPSNDGVPSAATPVALRTVWTSQFVA